MKKLKNIFSAQRRSIQIYVCLLSRMHKSIKKNSNCYRYLIFRKRVIDTNRNTIRNINEFIILNNNNNKLTNIFDEGI